MAGHRWHGDDGYQGRKHGHHSKEADDDLKSLDSVVRFRICVYSDMFSTTEALELVVGKASLPSAS